MTVDVAATNGGRPAPLLAVDNISVNFGAVLALQPDELVPEMLRVLLLSLPSLALLAILRHG